MDTTEGNQEDPLSLHKYLYCQNDPVNGIDPSGRYDQGEGYAMERLIAADYAEAHPMAHVRYGQQALVGRDPTLKPDIFNTTDKTYAEIKPLTLAKISQGLAQLQRYEDSLGILQYTREQWPADSIAGVRMVFYDWSPYFYFNVDGLILYTRVDPELFLLPVPLSIGSAKVMASQSAKMLARGAATTMEDVFGQMAIRTAGVATADMADGVAAGTLTSFSGVQE
jgi:hypothetical protein